MTSLCKIGRNRRLRLNRLVGLLLTGLCVTMVSFAAIAGGGGDPSIDFTEITSNEDNRIDAKGTINVPSPWTIDAGGFLAIGDFLYTPGISIYPETGTWESHILNVSAGEYDVIVYADVTNQETKTIMKQGKATPKGTSVKREGQIVPDTGYPAAANGAITVQGGVITSTDWAWVDDRIVLTVIPTGATGTIRSTYVGLDAKGRFGPSSITGLANGEYVIYMYGHLKNAKTGQTQDNVPSAVFTKTLK